jgi:hypothetical protein
MIVTVILVLTWCACVAALPVALYLLSAGLTRPPWQPFERLFGPVLREMHAAYVEMPLRVFTGRYRPAPPARSRPASGAPPSCPPLTSLPPGSVTTIKAVQLCEICSQPAPGWSRRCLNCTAQQGVWLGPGGHSAWLVPPPGSARPLMPFRAPWDVVNRVSALMGTARSMTRLDSPYEALVRLHTDLNEAVNTLSRYTSSAPSADTELMKAAHAALRKLTGRIAQAFWEPGARNGDTDAPYYHS